MKIPLFLPASLLAAFCVQSSLCLADTTLNITNRYSYGANLGWMDWRGDNTNGAVTGQFVCSGYLWSANAGWINLGNGLPADGIRYQNNSAADFGVNRDQYGNLRGYAWGADIGWLTFTDHDINGTAFEGPKVDPVTGGFSGYIWSANIGWISLSNSQAHVQTDAIVPATDADGDGIPDAWEFLHFGNLTSANATTDHDGDGFTDLQEILAGSDPFDPGSTPNNLVPECVAPPSGLAAWWRAEGDANDAKGTNNGTLVNGATFAPGKTGSAFSLGGVNDYIEVPDAPSLNPVNALTVEAWYQPTISFKGNGANAIVDKGYASHSPPFYQYHLFVVGNQGWGSSSAAFGFWVAAGGNSYYALTPGTNWTPGFWYHLTGAYDGSAVKIYVNGVLIASSPASGTMTDYGRPLRIGAFDNLSGSDSYTPGLVDEVAIYNRALTANEIAALYTAGSAGKCLTISPISLINSAVIANQFGFDLTGEANLTVVIEGSSNLLNWTSLKTNILGAAPLHFADPSSSALPKRFYRARVQP
jgi:hypothetical protein